MPIYESNYGEEEELSSWGRLPGEFEYVSRIDRAFLWGTDVAYLCYDECGLFLFQIPWITVETLLRSTEWNKNYHGWERIFF